ncbi:MAG TPA: hypothetical protein VGQ11_02700 [Candidatus Acidoferrales bacterium]|nr:hypothetical protein [Candidatus Acidoferrales bacterium]
MTMTVVLFLLATVPLYGQGAPETVGRIEGDDIAVKGQVSLLRESGQNAAELTSGADVTVRSGLARITLADGGEIDICGPARFSVLKSGGSLTLALNLGRVHARIGAEASGPAVTIYTALVVAALISVGNRPRDVTVGVDADGSLGIVAAHGAVRLEQQLTGQSIVVPERGEVLLPGGQLEALRTANGACVCEPVFARGEPPAPKPPQMGAVAVSSGDGVKPESAKKEPPKPATEEPRWTVLMPPLAFDATKPPPALEPRPETILLVRELRVQPALIISGRVERPEKKKTPQNKDASAMKSHAAKTPDETKVAVATPAAPASTRAAASADTPVAEQKTGGGFGAKLKNFFRRLFGVRPKR